MLTPGSRHPARRADLAIAAALLVLGQLEVALRGTTGSQAAAHVLWAAAAVAVTLRRAHPLLLLAWALVVFALAATFDLAPGGAADTLYLPLALVGLGAFVRESRHAIGAALFGLLAIAGLFVVLDLAGAISNRSADEWLRDLAIFAPAAAGGVILRDRAEVLRAARARVRAASCEAAAVDLALSFERTRIARELHAVVAGCVRAVLGEAATARAALDGQCDGAASAALRRARAASQQAMSEMRRMLALLRGDPLPPAALRALVELVDGRDGASAARPALARRAVPPLLRAQGIPLLLLTIELGEALLSHGRPAEFYGTATVPVRVAGAIAIALAFVPRRRWPLATVLAVVASAFVRSAVFDDAFGLGPPLYLAAFVAGAYARPAWRAAVGGVAVAAGGVLTVGLQFDWNWQLYTPNVMLFFATMVAAAWVTGFGGRRQLAEAEELRALAAVEERLHALAIERAVNAERLGVARELHDLVGHGLTSITLQSAVADQMLGSRPADARAAIAAVEEAGEEVLDELRQLLAVLGGRRAAARRGAGRRDAGRGEPETWGPRRRGPPRRRPERAGDVGAGAGAEPPDRAGTPGRG